MFSILIPSWNNLPYLQLCVDSVRRHSSAEHEILVHVNDGADGTLAWVRAQGLRHTHSEGNVGVCLALNQVAQLATRPWLLFLNDDMVCLPGWDRALAQTLAAAADPRCYLSSTLIEPAPTPNPLVIVRDFGTTPAGFDEAGLLAFARTVRRADVLGTPSQPTVVARELWHLVGGYSIEFGPGMSSDDDFLMKLWLAGCHDFRTLGSSLVYHFGCRTTGRIRRNHGSREFLMKWGITQREFKSRYLDAIAAGRAHELPDVPAPGWRSRLKRVLYGFAPYPLGDLRAWDAGAAHRLRLATPPVTGTPTTTTEARPGAG